MQYKGIIPPEAMDAIVFGDIPEKYKEQISCDDPIIKYFFVTGLIKKYFNAAPPKNSSEATYKELLYNKKLSEEAPEEYLQFALNTDLNEDKFYSDFANEILGLNLSEKYFHDLFIQVEPILFLLKQKFDRPRPYQLAPLYNIQIHNKIAHHHNYPAYPGGHALDAYIAAYAMVKRSPQNKKKIYDFCDTVINSRMMTNLHFLSDTIIAKKLAEDIIKHNLIKNI